MRIEVTTSKLPKVRENAGDQDEIDLSFASDWLREWREFSGPITEQRKAKLLQSRITINIQLKIALSGSKFHS